MGAGGGGPHMGAGGPREAHLSSRALTLRYDSVLGAITVETSPPWA